MRHSARSRRAFTLVELLVVIVILGILIAVALPTFLRQQSKAQDSRTQQYLTTAYKAIRSGTPDTNNQYPQSTTMVSWVQQSEPELTAQRGSCTTQVQTAPQDAVLVDPASSANSLTLCARSQSGNVYKLTASATGVQSLIDGTLVPFTLSGNEITDAVRAENPSVVGHSYDGLSNDSSTGVWDAATNLMPNGGFETSVAAGGWNGLSCCTSNATANQSGHAMFGAGSLKLTYDGGAGTTDVRYNHATIAASANTTYTISAWVDASGLVAPARSNWGILVMDQTGLGIANTTLASATSGWVRQTVTVTTGATVTGLNVALMAPQGTVYWDGVQLEKAPYATPYIETNGASASRGQPLLQVPSGVINGVTGAIALRIRLDLNAAQTAQTPNGECSLFSVDSATSGAIRAYVNSSGNIVLTRSASSGGNGGIPIPGFTSGSLHTFLFTWTATNIYLSVDGGSLAPVANTPAAGLSTLAPTFYLGGTAASNGIYRRPLDGEILWAATMLGTPSNADAATINSFGNNDPKLSQFPAADQTTMVWNGNSPSGSLK